MMPPLMPQPRNPVATQRPRAPGCSGPTSGTVSVASVSWVAHPYIGSVPGKLATAQSVSRRKHSSGSPVPGVMCSPVTSSSRLPGSSSGAVRTERVFSSEVMYMPSGSRESGIFPATTNSRRGERREKSRARSKTG